MTVDSVSDICETTAAITGGIMTPELLRLAGEAIFGLNWKRPMAKALGYSARHISRIMNPDDPNRPLESIRPILLKLLEAKGKEVNYATRILHATDEDGNVIIPGASGNGEGGGLE